MQEYSIHRLIHRIRSTGCFAHRVKTISCAFAVIGTFALADTKPTAQDAQTVMDSTCKQVGNFAQALMLRRQEGHAMSEVMDAMAAANGGTVQPDIRNIIMAAYAEPRMMTPENQKRQVEEFRNDQELACFTKFSALIGAASKASGN